MGDVLVGTCGYSRYDPGEGWKERYESKLQAYSDAFRAVELNRTFYELPMVETAERWRRETVEGFESKNQEGTLVESPEEAFEFAVKAWQAMTHPWRSPTWNGHRGDVPEDRTDEVGYLRPTEFVEEAWRETRKHAEALEAETVLIQTPPSFGASEEHEEGMRELLGERIECGGLELAWEPRGGWREKSDQVAEVCRDLDLIHVTDLMRGEPVSSHRYAYTRLHGLNEDPNDYDYDYSDDELADLAERLRELAGSHERVYCFFNNYEMYRNADSLARMLEG